MATRTISTRTFSSTGTGGASPAKPVAVAGAVSALLYLAGFALSPAAALDSGSTGARIARYATLHRSQILASDLLLALGLPVLMIFAAALYRVIRRTEDQDGWLAMAALVTAVAGAGIFGAGTALFMTVAYRPATDPALVRALWDAGWMAYNSAGFAFSAWIVIVTVSTLTSRALPSWTVWVGVPVALINVVGPLAVKAGTGAFSPQGSFALIVGLTFAVWVIAISFAAWRSARAPAIAS